MLVGDVAPHHHAFAVGAEHSVDAVDVLVINGFGANRIHISLGKALAKCLGLVTVDVEIR